LFRFCPYCARDVSRWALAGKVLTSTAVLLMLYCAIPPATRAQQQTPDEVRIEELRRRVNMLDDVSIKIGAMGERINSLAESTKALQAQADSMSTRVWAAMLSALMIAIERLLRAFGVTVRGAAPAEKDQ
jgi:chemotaxis protein histidine kinase CheA